MKITGKTTDLKIGTLLRVIKKEEHSPFELGKIYSITNGDCVGTYEIGNNADFGYSINNIGNYFELVEDIEIIKSKLTNAFYAAHTDMIENQESDLHKDILIKKAIENIFDEHEYSIDALTSISQKISLPETTFIHKDTTIVLPFFEATTIESDIDPLLLYGSAYTDCMIDFYTHKFNFLLSGTNHAVDIYQTDDYYDLSDYLEENSMVDGIDFERLEEEGIPMFEACIREIDTEDDVEDTTTGRYCSIGDVLSELESNVFDVLSELNHRGYEEMQIEELTTMYVGKKVNFLGDGHVEAFYGEVIKFFMDDAEIVVTLVDQEDDFYDVDWKNVEK